MRRDLELDCDPAELVLSPPDRSRAEGDVPPLRVPQPARPGRRARRGAARAAPDGGRGRRRRRWREGELPRRSRARRRSRSTATASRVARDGRRRRRRLVRELAAAPDAELVAPRRQGAAAARCAGRRHAARGVPDRPGPRRRTRSTSSPPEYGIELDPEPAAEEETAALVRRAAADAAPRDPLLRARSRERGADAALPRRSSCR